MQWITRGPWPEPTVLTDVEAVPVAAVRADSVTVSDLPEVFDRGYARVADALAAAEVTPVGPAVAIYDGDVTDRFDVEAGFPLDGPFVQADGDVVVTELPHGDLAVLTHVGPYEALPGAWERLMGWLAQAGRAPAPRFGEIYVTEPLPDVDPATLRTDIFVALA